MISDRFIKMKLIIAGATGFVATEVIRLALSDPRVTSVIALARRITPIPQNTAHGADISKPKAVACDNFEEYPENVKNELSNADACIWYRSLVLLSFHLTLFDSVD